MRILFTFLLLIMSSMVGYFIYDLTREKDVGCLFNGVPVEFPSVTLVYSVGPMVRFTQADGSDFKIINATCVIRSK